MTRWWYRPIVYDTVLGGLTLYIFIKIDHFPFPYSLIQTPVHGPSTCLQIITSSLISLRLKRTFRIRKDAAMRMTVLNEVAKCPPLRLPVFVSIYTRICYFMPF